MEENKPKVQVNVNCRFYEKRFPEEGELVMVSPLPFPLPFFLGSSNKRCGKWSLRGFIGIW